MPRQSYRTLGLSIPVSEVLDPQLWRERYAWGVQLGGTSLATRLRIQQGGKLAERELRRLTEAIPDDVVRWHLRAALSELDLKLGMPMGLEVIKGDPVDVGLVLGQHYDRTEPRRPFDSWQQEVYYRLDLPGGVISVERVRAYYYGVLIWTFGDATASSIHLEWDRQGSVHFLPLNLQSLMLELGQGTGIGPWSLIRRQRNPLPNFWCVDYTRGPVSKQGGRPGEIEVVLADWCYAVAGIKLLSIGGIATSKGLSSTSLSLDGVSRSVGLQASAIYGLNSALEHVLEECSKRIDWKRLRAYKRGLKIIPF